MTNDYARTPSRLHLLSLFLLSTLVPISVSAGARSVNVAEMTSRAGRIVHGRVVDVRNGVHPGDDHLAVTFIRVQVLEMLKGTAAREVEFMQFGNANNQYATHLPRYSVGEEVILFLYPESRLGLTSPVGEGQGKFLIRDDVRTGRRILINEQLNQAIFSRLDPAKMTSRLALSRAERDVVGQNEITNSRGLEFGSFRGIVRKLAANPKANLQ